MMVGGGQMGDLIRAFNWHATPLGPIAGWSASLRSAIGICLGSRLPCMVWWGHEQRVFYNDACIPILGINHLAMLGQPGAGPTRLADAGVDQLLVIERDGHPSETYFVFTCISIQDTCGDVEGILGLATETTERVIRGRRLRTLRELAALARVAVHAEEACGKVAEVLARNPADIPFARVYLLDAKGAPARPAGTLGPGSRADLSWPFRQVAMTGESIVADAPLASAEEPHSAWVTPLRVPTLEWPIGVLVLGLNPRRGLDNEDRGFFDLVASQVTAIIGSCVDVIEQPKRDKRLQISDGLHHQPAHTFVVTGLAARTGLAELRPQATGDAAVAAFAHVGELATRRSEHLNSTRRSRDHADRESRAVSVFTRLVRDFQQRTGIDADLVVTVPDGRLPADVADTLHEVGREALANVERRSRASAVVLGLTVGSGSASLSIQDDGDGRSGRAVKWIEDGPSHPGLRSASERVRRMGGTFVTRPGHDGGLVVRARVPLNGAGPG
jgi:hypothetical protein